MTLFSPVELALAAALLVCASVVSMRLALDVHRQILWSACRMIVQLLLIGMVLEALFQSRSLMLSLGLLTVMIVAAIRETGARPAVRLSAGFNFIASGTGIVLAVVVVVGFSVGVQQGHHDMTDPRVLIPITGIILGTAMNAASIALNAFLRDLRHSRAAIEAMLALGYDKHAALRPFRNAAMQAGLIPTLNQMAGAGIITLPGIMSGQVLAGQDPVTAAYAQIFLMLMLCVAALIAICGTLWIALSRVTDDRERLRMDRVGGLS